MPDRVVDDDPGQVIGPGRVPGEEIGRLLCLGGSAVRRVEQPGREQDRRAQCDDQADLSLARGVHRRGNPIIAGRRCVPDACVSVPAGRPGLPNLTRNTRTIGSSLLAVVAVVALLLALLTGYASRVLFDSDQFVKANPDLIGVRPVLEGAASAIVGSSPFRALLRPSVEDLHRTIFDRE